ncbi:MAG: hypothetical protein WC400_03680 [Patescibacteria group bacterium]
MELGPKMACHHDRTGILVAANRDRDRAVGIVVGVGCVALWCPIALRIKLRLTKLYKTLAETPLSDTAKGGRKYMRITIFVVVVAVAMLMASCNVGPKVGLSRTTSSTKTATTPLNTATDGDITFISMATALDSKDIQAPNKIMAVVNRFKREHPDLVVTAWHEYYAYEPGLTTGPMFIQGVFIDHRNVLRDQI